MQYESLRAETLGEGDGRCGGLGWALLARRGMAAWLDAWSMTKSPPGRRAGRETEQAVGLLPEGRDELVMVLTGMALQHSKEDTYGQGE